MKNINPYRSHDGVGVHRPLGHQPLLSYSLKAIIESVAWAVVTTRDFDDWFAGLSEGEMVEVAAAQEVLSERGPMLGRPWVDTLSGSKHANMKELRVQVRRAVLRIAFAFDPSQQAILLTAGDKAGVKQRRFYRQLIAKADRLYDEHLAVLARRRSRRK